MSAPEMVDLPVDENGQPILKICPGCESPDPWIMECAGGLTWVIVCDGGCLIFLYRPPKEALSHE